MRRRSVLKTFTCGTAIASVLQPSAMAALAGAAMMSAFAPAAHAAPTASACADITSTVGKVTCLKSKVKYVFVIFQENESFDHYFGTFPGANGLFKTQGNSIVPNASNETQNILSTSKAVTSTSVFLMPQAVLKGGYNSGAAASTNAPATPIYPADWTSMNHGHTDMANAIDYVSGSALNDRYALDNENKLTTCVVPAGAPANPGDCPAAITGAVGSTQVITTSGTVPGSISEANVQKGEANLSHIDCDTIPFMWAWAKNFVLFDNFHQTMVGPSTTNAISLIGGQAGQTQYGLHHGQANNQSTSTLADKILGWDLNEGPKVSFTSATVPASAAYTSNNTQSDASFAYEFPSITTSGARNANAYVPVIGDPGPWPGSSNDTYATTGHAPPYNFDESPTTTSYNLTFASLPLSFMGNALSTLETQDQSPLRHVTTWKGTANFAVPEDLEDVADDLAVIATQPAVSWGWYQQGYDTADSNIESQDVGGASNLTTTSTNYPGYVLHHNGPQYFAYLADNKTVLTNNLHGSQDFFTAVNSRSLSPNGGVFYLRGGYNNNNGLVPLLPPNATAAASGSAFIGNDDHPAYSDQQISEALAAKAINAIVNSPYWSQSAIVVTYDETDGFYDHAPVTNRAQFPDGSLMTGGPRIPTIVISPWAAAGTISHNYSEHGSLIKLIDLIFGLTPLASLPDETAGANAVSGLGDYSPSDNPANGIGNMLEAFDFNRMKTNNPIPGSMATFPDRTVQTLPHLAVATPSNPTAYSPNGYTNGACKVLNILPTDFVNWSAYQAGTPVDPYPIDANPRATGTIYTN